MNLDISNVSVQIAFPTYDGNIPVQTAVALASTAAQCAHNNLKVGVNYAAGCALVDMVRNTLVRDFLETDYQKLLMIDSDIIFKPSDVFRLMAWSTKYDIVAASYPCKTTKNAAFFCMPTTNPPTIVHNDLVEVNGVGAGFLLIDRKVFEYLKDHVPSYFQGGFNDLEADPKLTHAFFQITYNDNTHRGEDLSFIRLARQHGFPTYVDLRINPKHVGKHTFDYEVSELAKQQGWIS